MRFFRTESRAPLYNESPMQRENEGMDPSSAQRGSCRGEPIGSTYRSSMREGVRERSSALNEEALMRKVQELSFMAVELQLYLDAYPDSAAALDAYRKTTSELAGATRQYEEHFGPLTASSSRGDRWTWTMGKWPWQTDEWR